MLKNRMTQTNLQLAPGTFDWASSLFRLIHHPAEYPGTDLPRGLILEVFNIMVSGFSGLRYTPQRGLTVMFANLESPYYSF